MRRNAARAAGTGAALLLVIGAAALALASREKRVDLAPRRRERTAGADASDDPAVGVPGGILAAGRWIEGARRARNALSRRPDRDDRRHVARQGAAAADGAPAGAARRGSGRSRPLGPRRRAGCCSWPIRSSNGRASDRSATSCARHRPSPIPGCLAIGACGWMRRTKPVRGRWSWVTGRCSRSRPARSRARARSSESGFVARCRIGRGRATVIADADFLDIEQLPGLANDNLDALLAELAALEP